MLLVIVFNKFQESCIYLFLINRSVNYLDISPENICLKVICLEIFDSEFSYIELWFTDQNSNPLKIEDKINLSY